MDKKNYLLFVPSRLTASPKFVCYKINEEETDYVGMQTNEAVTKYLVDYLYKKDMKLDKIIMLCTEEVMHEKMSAIEGRTTLEYYQEAICSFLAGNEKLRKKYEDVDTLFEIIPYPVAVYEVDEIKKLLDKVIKITGEGEETSRKHLYVDFTGGPRSAALALIFTCRILQLGKIEVEKILYSNIVSGQEGVGKIEECTQVYNVFAMLEAKEALAHGDSSKMMHHLKQTGKEDIRETFENIDKKIANREIANQTNQIDEILKESKGIVKEAEQIANVKDSVEAELILEGLKSQVSASRRIVENSQYKELIRIEELLEKKKYDNALNLFREKIIRIMVDAGIIKVCSANQNSEKLIANEFLGVYCYYETLREDKPDKGSRARKTFLDAVHDYIDLLSKDQEKEPIAVLNEWKHKFYDMQEYTDRVPEWRFSHTGYSRRTCKEKIIPYLESYVKPEMNVSELIDQYQKMEQIYMGYGFPFACTYGGSWFFGEYEKIYKANIRRGAESLKKYFQGDKDERMKRALDCFPEESFTYGTLLQALQKKQYERMLHVLFPFQLSNKNIHSDAIEGEKWERFVYDFAQSFYFVKQVRNKFTHPDILEKEDFKKAIQTVEQVISQIKEIQEQRDKQGLRIDKIPWANQYPKRQKGSEMR